MICRQLQKKKKAYLGLSKKCGVGLHMARFRRKMTESGDFGQIIKEITDDHSKHVAKLRSDALEQREMQEWYNELEKENKERREQENANKQHVQNKPENTVQNKPAPKEISNDNDSPSPGF